MSTVHYDAHGVTLHHGDCLAILATLPDASVDAVVTDPPYGLEFMGKEWDAPWRDAAAKFREPTAADEGFRVTRGSMPDAYRAGVPFQQWCTLWAAECLRVLKPGGHLLAFGGTRTWHRLACAIEDAGFEIRDSIAWMYGSGFPKSLDVSKAIDKAAGATREVVGIDHRYVGMSDRAKRALGAVVHEGTGATGFSGDPSLITAPATPEAARWAGWGTALKPAHEPIVVARKPLAGTVAANVLAHGTGALNVDATRIGVEKWDAEANRCDSCAITTRTTTSGSPSGRWPSNVVLDESQAAALGAQSGVVDVRESRDPGLGDSGGASRFMYVAKADTDERPCVAGAAHPTVKPIALMRWLVRLVTPPGGVVLEPFAGSGTTAEACLLEGFRCIAVEREADYLPLIVARITRQRDPVAHVRLVGDAELTLFDEEPA